MDVLKIADEIQKKVALLEAGRKELKARGEAKANAIGDYRRTRAIVLMKLRNGVEMELDGERIKDPPTSIMESIARGICFQEKINEELATVQYKNATVGMEALQAELNGLQSIYKHLAET